MKKTIIAICTIGLMAFAADKFVTVKFTEPQINYHWQNLEGIKAVVDRSDLKHNEAKFIIGSIDSLQKDIARSAKIDSVRVDSAKLRK